MCAPSVALGEGFLVAAACSMDVSGADTDTHKRPCPVLPYTQGLKRSASAVAPSDLCIMRDRPREVCKVSSGRALLKPTGLLAMA